VQYAVRRITPAMKPALLGAVVGSMILLPAIEEWQLLQRLPEILQYAPLCFVLICSVCLLASLGADLKAGTIVLLGDASYVMYLTHPYVIQFLDRVVGRIVPAFHVDSTIGVLFAMMLVMPLSVLLYLKVDKPVIVYLNNLLCGRKRPDPASYVAPLEPVATLTTPLVSQASAS
jgi:exopolysaccharide production protein ExoZ